MCSFARSIHRSKAVADVEQKSRIVTSLLETAIAKTDLHAIYAPSVGPPLDPQRQYAHRLIEYCERCDCKDFIPPIVDKLADTSGLKAKEAQEKAEKLMSMLVALWSKTSVPVVSTYASESLENLRKTTVDLILDAIQANPTKPTKERIAALLKTGVKNGNTEWLISEYVVLMALRTSC